MDNIEVNGTQAAFASRAEPAWHRLGTVFPLDEEVTTTQMLAKAHLSGWNLRKEALAFAVPNLVGLADDGNPVYGDPEYLPVNAPLYANVRDNPFTGKPEAISVVGERFHNTQNEELFAWADGMLAGGGLWETAGSIDGGRRVFGAMSIDRTLVIDPTGVSDTVRTYLLVAAGHDGTMPITGLITPTRVVCQNTLNYALNGSASKFKVRHTKSSAERMAVAREALNITFKHMDAFEAEAEALYQAAMTARDFDRLMDAAFPKPEEGKSDARWKTRVEEVRAIYAGQADGPNTTEGIRGTWWGGLNAITEYFDWYQPGRGAQKADNRAAQASGLNGDTSTNAKADVRGKVLALAGI